MKSVFRQYGLFKVSSMNDSWKALRRHSRGWMEDPPAKVHVSIMFGAGFMVTPAFIAKHGITHVVNCAQDSDSPQWFREHNPTKYACINAVDNTSVDITGWYPRFANTMDRFLRDSDSKVVFVHCQCGINRSGFLTLLYCIQKFGYEFESTAKIILAQRPCALTNPAFRLQVMKYQKF